MNTANDSIRQCAKCNRSLGEEAVMALNRLWHPEHFLCTSCGNPIRQTFQAADNSPYCVQCFSHKFNPRCYGCKETLINSCLLALDKHWHARCFRCRLCDKPLQNGEFYLVGGKPYDLDCHWQKRLEISNDELKKRHGNHFGTAQSSRGIKKESDSNPQNQQLPASRNI